ncbi:cytochrome b [Sphingomonas sp.]|uniref:cytochrome b n=1 Tax=Sphingomonas sp. TaxID=28214 RepID=UPI003B009F3D
MIGGRSHATDGGRYTATAIAFHWVIAALIVVNLAIGLIPPLGILFFLHKPIGIVVLVLSALRLVWRAGHPAPPLPGTVAPWNRALASVTQWLLYMGMILMPVSGWVFTSASLKRRPLSFGLFDVPPLPVMQSDAVGAPWHQGHVVGGWIMLGLVALHVAGALKHHFLDRDATLDRMLPRRRPVSL